MIIEKLFDLVINILKGLWLVIEPFQGWVWALVALVILYYLYTPIRNTLGRFILPPILKRLEGRQRKAEKNEAYRWGINRGRPKNERVPKYHRRAPQPPALLDIKADLMCHPEVRQTLAPSNVKGRWLSERETVTVQLKDAEGNPTGKTEEHRKVYPDDLHAWLSPYPDTVKAYLDASTHNSNTQRYQPRKEVKYIAEQITIREATAGESAGLIIPQDIKNGVYMIEFSTRESKPSTIRSLEEAVKSRLKLEKLEEIKEYPGRIIYRARKQGVTSYLDTALRALEWLPDNAPKSNLKRIPLAPTSTGKTWGINLKHTLVAGISGAGKSSPIHMLLAQMAPYVMEGRVRITAIDPKDDGDIRKHWAGSPIVEKCGASPEEYARVIQEFHESMRSRAVDTPDTLTQEAALERKDKVKDFTPTKETPLRFLVIDEITEFVGAMEGLGALGKEALDKLDSIMRLGRSSGHIVFAATQSPNRDAFGALARVRTNFANTIALKLGTTAENDFMLGSSAIATGHDATAIPQGQPGIAWVKDADTGEYEMVRFPYFDNDNEELFNFVYQYLPTKEEVATSSAPLPSLKDIATEDDAEPAAEEAAPLPDFKSLSLLDVDLDIDNS